MVTVGDNQQGSLIYIVWWAEMESIKIESARSDIVTKKRMNECIGIRWNSQRRQQQQQQQTTNTLFRIIFLSIQCFFGNTFINKIHMSTSTIEIYTFTTIIMIIKYSTYIFLIIFLLNTSYYTFYYRIKYAITKLYVVYETIIQLFT